MKSDEKFSFNNSLMKVSPRSFPVMKYYSASCNQSTADDAETATPTSFRLLVPLSIYCIAIPQVKFNDSDRLELKFVNPV